MNSKSLITTLTLITSAFLAWQLRWVLLIIFGAVVISVGFDVLIKKIQRFIKLSRKPALGIVLILLLIGGSVVYTFLAPELIIQTKDLENLAPNLIDKLKSILSGELRLLNLENSFPEKISWENIQPISNKLLGFAGGAANSIFQLLLTVLLAILLALDPNAHRKILISATPRSKRKTVEELLDQCRNALGGWLSGMTISAISVFLLTWAGLSFLKVPLALLSALICGILTFVPIIGPTAASLLPLGVSLLISPSLMIQVLILRLALQNFEAFLLTPLLLRRTVNLLPTVALTSQLSLGALLGLPGVLLALPLAVVLQVGMQKILVKQVMDKL
ncbi:AI-2E family transporter [Prochlorococcus sp. MIT 1341]|uniref:AI-2E family transporter n=1 Tax=Prochlorococcus sp. MIT 1341 TaxID=3096221 RepID=UPI002A75E5C4|nr:AI-2E family transporter [Prochlorococcus sp. MIT 1341]